MAPPTLPTEVKRRRGTLRADRTPTDLVAAAPEAKTQAPAVALDVPAPEHLGEAGRAEWRHTLETCRWVGMSDLTALLMLCEAIDRRSKLAAELTKTGASLMLETSTGYAYANPALAALDKTEERITKWMSLLGKTPSDRSRLGVAEVQTASTLDKLAARRRARGGPPGSTPRSRSSSSATETATSS